MPSESAPEVRRFGEKVLDVISGRWADEDASPEPDSIDMTFSSFWADLVRAVSGEWGAAGKGDAYSTSARATAQGLALASKPGPDPGEGASLNELLAWLKRHSAKDRLDFRTHVGLPRHAYRKPCGCVEARRRVFKSAAQRVSALQIALIVGLDWSPTEATTEAVQAVAHFLEQVLTFDRPLDLDLVELRQLLADALTNLRVDGGPENLRGRLAELVQNLESLDAILNDYTNADLSALNLSNYRLEGMRWSQATKWPRRWRRRVVRNSIEVAPGTFVVSGDDPEMRGPTNV